MEEKTVIEGLMSDKEALQKEKNALTVAVQEMDTEMQGYKALGSVEELEDLTTKLETLMSFLEGIEDVKSIKEKLELLAKYEELGTYEQLGTALDRAQEMIAKYKEIGTPEKIGEALDRATGIISVYKELGTPDQLGEALDVLEDSVVEQRCEEIAARFGKKSETVQKMYEKVNDFEVVESLLDDVSTKPDGNGKSLEEGNSASPVITSTSVIARVSKTLI